MKLPNLLLSLCLSCSCAVSTPNAIVAPAEIIASLPARESQVVHVIGILAFNGHARQLWTVGSSRDQNENCLTLVNTEPFEAALGRLDGQRITIAGTVIPDVSRDPDGNPVLDYGACNTVGLLVRAIR